MNREILFRGKRADNGEWVEGNYVEVNTSGLSYSLIMGKEYDAKEKCITNHAVVIPSTVGQYTGLNDKRGVKIFEGDILETSNGNRGCVVFQHGAFMKSCDPKDAPFLIASDVNAVIGNIHDDSELLGGESNV